MNHKENRTLIAFIFVCVLSLAVCLSVLLAAHDENTAFFRKYATTLSQPKHEKQKDENDLLGEENHLLKGEKGIYKEKMCF